MRFLALSTSALLVSATSAFAQQCDPSKDDCAVPVPEISALEGTAALAVIAAVVLLAWERRRRAA